MIDLDDKEIIQLLEFIEKHDTEDDADMVAPEFDSACVKLHDALLERGYERVPDQRGGLWRPISHG